MVVKLVGMTAMPRACVPGRHGREAEGGQGVAIFFAFADEHRLRRERFRQPVEHTLRSVEIPRPAALTIRPALTEFLGGSLQACLDLFG